MTEELYVVGIGASAGGLKAMSSLISNIEDDKENLCMVVVQHMKSDYKSELANILGKRISSWDVREAKDNTKLKRNVIYVAPSTSTIVFNDDTISLQKSEEDHHPSPSIDIFLKSLAEEIGTRSVGVILSGTGNDGVEGMEQIKIKGGLTIGQLPNTAANPELPQNVAIFCDLQVPPEDIYLEIIENIHNHKIVNRLSESQEKMNYILELLKEKTGTHFTKYKQNTITRRVKKRIEALNLANLEQYQSYIRNKPAELDRLFETILIGVTEFFRDKNAFDEFRPQLEQIIKEKDPGEALRIWSVGCATGEEAYSVAMMLHDIGTAHLNTQIFATDIDEKALKKARRGLYTSESIGNVPQRLLDKYFVEVENGYEIIKQVRQHVLFSKHDITFDPPFVKLDIIICRNLLIYFKSDLQKDILKIFHYALRPDGLLFLGKSENATIMSELFDQYQDSKKLYRRADGSSQNAVAFSSIRRKNYDRKKEPVSQPKEKGSLTLIDHAKETLFHSLLDSSFVIINEHHQVKEIKGSMRPYLELSEGSMDSNIFKMLQKELSMELRMLLARLSKEPTTQSGNIVRYSLFDKDYFVRLKVAPLHYGKNIQGYTMILFEKIDVDPKYISFKESLKKEDLKDLRYEELEQELASAKEHIQTFTEELETSNEELQSLNEELQSANEELKSSNEELETSNEELQSTNEELQTSNAELRVTNTELIKKERELKRSRDMLSKSENLYKTLAENFPNGAIGILDNKHIVQFIAGKDLKSIGFNKKELLGQEFYYKNEPEKEKLKKFFDAAFEGEAVHSFFSKGQYNYLLNIIPLHYDNKIDQVIFVTQNITAHGKLTRQLEESEQRFKVIADTAPVMIWMCDENMKCTYVNAGWLRFTGREQEDELDYGWLEMMHPDDKENVVPLFRRNFAKQASFSMEYRLKDKQGDYRYVIHNAIPHIGPEGDFIGYLGGCADINTQKQMEIKKDEFLNIASHELNTPLTTLKVYIDLMADEIESTGDENLKKYIGKSVRTAGKLEKLIRELLEVSRVELGKVKYQEEQIQLDIFLNSLVEDYQKLLDNHKLVIKSSEKVKINGDPELLEQVINNLISNASKFSPKTDKINITLSSNDKSAFIEVQDHGIGIDEEDLDRIFDRFYQVHTPNFRKGLGLGLYLCRQIIELHKGTIEATSKKKEGATFKITLPRIKD